MQVQTLGQQIFGKKDEYFEDAYRKATSLPWCCLMINLHPKTTRDGYKLLTHIISKQLTIVYQDINKWNAGWTLSTER